MVKVFFRDFLLKRKLKEPYAKNTVLKHPFTVNTVCKRIIVYRNLGPRFMAIFQRKYGRLRLTYDVNTTVIWREYSRN